MMIQYAHIERKSSNRNLLPFCYEQITISTGINLLQNNAVVCVNSNEYIYINQLKLCNIFDEFNFSAKNKEALQMVY
jgi:hypothetical protein